MDHEKQNIYQDEDFMNVRLITKLVIWYPEIKSNMSLARGLSFFSTRRTSAFTYKNSIGKNYKSRKMGKFKQNMYHIYPR